MTAREEFYDGAAVGSDRCWRRQLLAFGGDTGEDAKCRPLTVDTVDFELGVLMAEARRHDINEDGAWLGHDAYRCPAPLPTETP